MITSQLNTLRQSSARAWRIGQEKPCKTILMYYAGTSQEVAVKHMQAKLAAALYLEGELGCSGLAADDSDETLEQAILRSLESN